MIRPPVRLALLASISALAPAPGIAAEARRPNVVLIVADDLGYADVGFHGAKDIPTPHLDGLARGGVRCSNGYVSGPYCSPTRAGLLTGRYQQRFGHEFNPGNETNPKFGLPLAETTLADRLRSAGYHTGLVGKWHLGVEPRFRPQGRGFDDFYGFLGGGHKYFAADARNIYRGDAAGSEPDYLTDAIGREAVAFIDRNKDRPFFLEVAFNAVHTPMEATEARLARFAPIRDKTRRTYAAMLSALDDAVGAILGRLGEHGLEGDTLICFLSDNGGPTLRGTTINGSSNAPFRGSKRTTLEGGIRVPFVVSWKGVLPAGRVEDRPLIQLDLLPTALAAAGVAIDPAWKLDGVDLLPQLKGDPAAPAPHDALYWRLGEQDAIRRGDWKLVRYDSAVDDGTASRAARIKPTPRRLYNLAADPGESSDLAAEQPEKARELLAAWTAWDAQLAAPLWEP